MSTRKIIRFARTAYVLSHAARAAGASYLRQHPNAGRDLRHAWGGRRGWVARHPFLAGFGGTVAGLVAFSLLTMAFGVAFALLKVALVVGVVYLAFRMVRPRKTQASVLIIPPERYHRPARRAHTS